MSEGMFYSLDYFAKCNKITVLSTDSESCEVTLDEIMPWTSREIFTECCKIVCKLSGLSPSEYPLVCFYSGSVQLHFLWPNEDYNSSSHFVVPINIENLKENSSLALFETEKQIAFIGAGVQGLSSLEKLPVLQKQLDELERKLDPRTGNRKSLRNAW